MTWGGCLTALNVPNPAGVCGLAGPAMAVEATCLVIGEDPSNIHSACTVPCSADDPCSCPEPPMSGTAMVTCGNIDGEDGDECYLDCANDAQCPEGMACVDGGYCAMPVPPAPMYGDCIAGCAFPGVCAVSEDGMHQACVSPCFDVASCSDNPEPATRNPATVACGPAIAPPIGEECYLDCSMMMTNCPQGMTCVPATNTVMDDLDFMDPDTYDDICMWPVSPA